MTIELEQTVPKTERVQLEGLYLGHNLRERASKLGRPIVIANYITDKNDVIARKSTPGAAAELKNPDDWRLFQELTAQADAIITGPNYLNQFNERGQNVLTQFESGGEFETLGAWRLSHGYSSRNPDIVVASRSLDFEIPKNLGERKIIIFTTYDGQHSQKAEELREAGATVIGAGKAGVEGKIMLQELGKLGYKVIKNTTGPSVLKILLDGNVLDRLYITRVHREIKSNDPDDLLTVLTKGKVEDLPGFKLIEKYHQEAPISQDFLVYEKVTK